MDSSLSEEHHAVQNLARDFAEKEVAPIIKDADRKQEMPAFMLPRLGELGLLGLCIPVKYGGQGMDYVTLGLVCEELDYVDIALRTALSVHYYAPLCTVQDCTEPHFHHIGLLCTGEFD